MSAHVELRHSNPATGEARRTKRRETVVELTGQPLFEEGDKVVSLREVRNDGTYPGRDTGDILIAIGDVGYVKTIGTYLQMFYIYAVDFYDKRIIVGMRAHEMELVDDSCNEPQ